jgi:uncharacterized protein YacL (UPF0231 family)
MKRREDARKEFRRHQGRKRVDYPTDIQHQQLNHWFHDAVSNDMAMGTDVSADIQALLTPPSVQAKGYKSMYAYGNHIRVRGAEADMATCDSAVAATFLQSCRASSHDRNVRTTNLEYVGWVDEILSVDYGKFEVVLLYCTWAQANRRGARATMKTDEYGFSLFRFDRLVPYSADSFAFPLHVQQVFFSDEEENSAWKVVLRRQPRGARVESRAAGRPELHSLRLGRDEEYEGLRPQYAVLEAEVQTPDLSTGRRLTTEEAHQNLVHSEDDVDE